MNNAEKDRRHISLEDGMAAVQCNTAVAADVNHSISTAALLVASYGLMLSSDNAADVFGCSASHMRAMCASGEIPAIKVSQRWRIPAVKLAAIIDGETE